MHKRGQKGKGRDPFQSEAEDLIRTHTYVPGEFMEQFLFKKKRSALHRKKFSTRRLIKKEQLW